ncbi:hypothetical protein [Bifidobacterium eulemuris]|uniref:Preprotein translocase subunit SecB n=1 Tax=Bifidobacterium eulemuris TaxID=1765219 RepID=A0A7L9SQ41_9BIFI|nr:hypothetical protein [Bifidobacterium eulemuris]QOL32451.1 hypothetical protein BE0216_08335 [Bifidobacterium eulemuris]
MTERNLVSQFRQTESSASVKWLGADDDDVRYAMRVNFATSPTNTKSSHTLLLKTTVAFIRYSSVDELDKQSDSAIDAESVFFVEATTAEANAYELVAELWPVIRWAVLTQVNLLGKDMSRWLPVRISATDIVAD